MSGAVLSVKLVQVGGFTVVRVERGGETRDFELTLVAQQPNPIAYMLKHFTPAEPA